MLKIIDSKICDIMAFDAGVVYCIKELVPDEKIKFSFFGYDIKNNRILEVKKEDYQLLKFGNAFKAICNEVGNYVECETAFLNDGAVIVLLHTGEAAVYDANGMGIWYGGLLYHESPLMSISKNGSLLWGTSPEQKSVVSYSIAHRKFHMRIGGGKNSSFSEPTSVFAYNNYLYVADHGTNKIRTVNLKTFRVKDYLEFEEPIYKYLRTADKEVVVLESGTYIL